MLVDFILFISLFYYRNNSDMYPFNLFLKNYVFYIYIFKSNIFIYTNIYKMISSTDF